MKTKLHYLFMALALLALATLNSPLATAHAQGTAFTYQGQLSNSSGPASGTYYLTFQLWNASSGGSPVGGAVTTSSTVISNGLFTVILDFAGSFNNGLPYWLELGVRTNGAGSFATLSPRQELTPTPYAITAENVTGAVLASQLTGTLPSIVLSGTSLNASQLTSGTVPDAQLSANVALLNANQTFTGTNTFYRTSGPSRLIVSGYGSIDTTLFTGLGFQYANDGEGAIMSAFNDGYGYLSFYTKQGGGFPIAKQVIIDYYGGVAIDQQNVNNGTINDATTNGVGLTFGSYSGEGIASKRTAGGNQYGLDFYTSFANRMSIRQNGDVSVNNNLSTASLTVRSGGYIQVSGAGTNDTTTAAYIHIATAGNAYQSNGTELNNSLCNGDPNAILLVTPTLSPQGVVAVYNNHPIGVYYDNSLGRWVIFEQDGVTVPIGAAFNILIIKN